MKEIQPIYKAVHYSLDYKPQPGRKSEKAQRLVKYCLGDFVGKPPSACTKNTDYLQEKFILLLEADKHSVVLKSDKDSYPDDHKKIVEALISQRAKIPDNLSCWLIREDGGGRETDPAQGLHICGMRLRDHQHLVLVPTANRHRLLGPKLGMQMKTLKDDWIPWSEKTDTAWWGGALTGDRWQKSGADLLSRREVLNYFHENPSDHVILHLTNIPKHPAPKGIQVKGKFTKRDALHSKCLILLPGNDIASASSWYFAGNSVVMMPMPHMEHILYFEMNPWEHYVPLDNDPADILTKLEWVLDNESEARKIVERSHERLHWLCGPEYLWACNEVLRWIAKKRFLGNLSLNIRRGL